MWLLCRSRYWFREMLVFCTQRKHLRSHRRSIQGHSFWLTFTGRQQFTRLWIPFKSIWASLRCCFYVPALGRHWLQQTWGVLTRTHMPQLRWDNQKNHPVLTEFDDLSAAKYIYQRASRTLAPICPSTLRHPTLYWSLPKCSNQVGGRLCKIRAK